MDNSSDREERLREAASIGDVDSLINFCQSVNVNSQNNINGWTALHWAVKRNHVGIVEILLKQGADKNICNNKGETAAHLSKDLDILKLLGITDSVVEKDISELPITPNYLANPPFPYGSSNTGNLTSVQSTDVNSSHVLKNGQSDTGKNARKYTVIDNEVVLKARVANIEETDFIEVELDKQKLTVAGLVQLLCAELNVDSKLIHKIRKCPDTIIRKDKDVARLRDFQEVELVLSNKLKSPLIRSYGNYNNLGSVIKQEQILY